MDSPHDVTSPDSAAQHLDEGLALWYFGTMADDKMILVDIDGRGRVGLGRLHPPEGPYLASREADGTVILRPAVVMTQTQRDLLDRPDILDLMDDMAATPAKASRRGRPRRSSHD